MELKNKIIQLGFELDNKYLEEYLKEKDLNERINIVNKKEGVLKYIELISKLVEDENRG